MAAAFQNQEIANMNTNLYLLCVRCKNNARFICERCSDPYCTKTCQVMDWPFHRKMCFPMPSLLELEIPNERGLTSACDQRAGDSLALTYHTNSQNQYRFAPRHNNDMKIHNFPQMFAGQSFTKPVTQDLYFKSIDSGRVQPLDLGTRITALQTEPFAPTVIRTESESHQSSDTDAIVDLATTMKSDCAIPLRKSERQTPEKSPNRRDEATTYHVTELEQLTSNDSRNWQKAFPLQKDTLVTVVYSVETPTVNCWVVQNQHTTKSHQLLDEMKQLHCDNAIAKRVITNEAYSVPYEGKYYRGMCLYQINSKEALVRLIDVGVTFQTQISAMTNLHPRLKTIPAFASEINLDTPSDVSIGQTLLINQLVVDAAGTVNVKLGQAANSIESTHQTIQIDTVSIPVGVPVELFCLDYSNIDKGYISACVHDPKKIESINQLSDKITNYLKPFGKAAKYSPKLDELCFAYHDSEHQWYRAECIDRIGADSFEVIFFDYGIMRVVNSSNLRKFASEFSQPAMMHLCCIKGVPSKPTKELAKKITTFFNENPIFSIASAKYDDGMVIIDCPKLMNAIR